MASWEENQLRNAQCNFPKHRGKSWYDVCAIDADYVQWILDTIEDLDDHIRDLLEWGIVHVPMRL